MTLEMLGTFPLSLYSEAFGSGMDAVFVKCFLCIYREDHLVLVFSLADLISHTECLSSVEPALHPGDKCYLVTVSNFSMYRWILLARILLRTFASVFIGDIGL